MTKRCKALLVVAIIFLVLSVAMALLLRDAPPPDDADLRITYDDIPEEENAFTYFNLAAEALDKAGDKEEIERLQDMLKDGEWDGELVDDVLARNQDVFGHIEQGLACERCQVPEVTDYDTPLLYLTPWRKIGQLGAICAEYLFRHGHEEQAFEQALSMIKFGRKTQEGRGGFLNYVVGIAIKEVNLRQFRRMVGQTRLPPKELTPYMKRLANHGASEQGLADAIRIDYRCMCAYFDGQGDAFPRQFAETARKNPLLRRIAIKPNRTKRLLAETYRETIADIPKSRFKRATSKVRVYGPNSTWRLVRLVVAGRLGENLLYLMLPTILDGFYRVKCAENCSLAATQIALALKCYTLEHGELPDTLDALVPEYFKAIPLDDFDGKPMKYSKEKRVVYAVGADFTDNGGVSTHDKEGTWWDDGYDLIYKIGF